ncbi:MAG: substrate-binding domain-containing protein [Roseburia sp.]|nr:substrate-binding domain-containing protein [Roseburia sp.]MCM1279529.1 substrate-binding domain-containing protein [Robinsoniella sp.]
MANKNVTFADIAKYTNFSKTTISRYFNNPDSLTLENQQIIADALVALNYKENKVARILANGKTEFVGIIIPNLYLHYYAQILNEILSTYETFGYKFLVFTGHDREDVERRYIKELLSYKIEGMIVLSHTISSKELASYNIPIVTIEREDRYTCSVNSDNYMGAVQATSLLYKNDCDIFIHMNGDVAKNIPAYGRIQGFLDICKEYNLNHRLLLNEWGNTYKENAERIQPVLEEIEQAYGKKRKGIFLSNDTLANVFLNLLVKKYGTLPDDYRIVGFDDSSISREAIIPISTVGQQIDKIAYQAMELLVMQMNERKKRKPVPLEAPIHKVMAPILIRRNTTT